VREDLVVSVGELVRRLRRVVESVTPGLWIEGEVGSLRRAASGHVYFVLKDEREDAVIDCVMYRSQALRARQVLSDGARLQVCGRATVWAPRGRLQMTVEAVRAQGRGALLEALERLKKKLAAEGLFAEERKRAVPTQPKLVGVVTSGAGAAFEDICTVAFRRGGAHVVLAAAQVQGEGAPRSIVRAIDLIERHPDLQVLIVGRGGGSGEDLMAFNDEMVVRRIAACRVPVVSAVGHEIDTTLADLAADVRAATPSQAAEVVVPDDRARRDALARSTAMLVRAFRSRLLEDRATVDGLRSSIEDPRILIAERQQRVDDLLGSLERTTRRRLRDEREALRQRHGRLLARHPRAVVSRVRATVQEARARLSGAVRLQVQRSSAQLGARTSRLHSLSPLAVLGRGYAIASRLDGTVVRSPGEVHVGDELGLRLARGRLTARVTSIDVDQDWLRRERGGL
jgi:exodeoxyribonuclease VII large subunit